MTDKKILIAFYSQTGNTKHIAEIIKEKTHGDLCEIKAEIPYKSLYLGGAKRVKKERSEGTHPSILPVKLNLLQYDTVFLGTPNWGNGIAHPIMTFLEKNSLSGKIVYPFCTHGGGGIAHVAEDIEIFCPKAVLGKAFQTYGDGGPDANQKVSAWLHLIGAIG